MAKIFINYRRDDTIGTAGRLHDRLAQSFGRNNLFMDVDHIPAGVDFEVHLNNQVAACKVFLAVIGPNWLNAKDEGGGRRLDNLEDFVAIEIAAALARPIRVIPVLVDGARMPKAADLPESIKLLARRHAVDVRHTHFGRDAEALVEKVGEALEGELTDGRAWRWRAAALAIAATLLLAGWVAFYGTDILPMSPWTLREVQDANKIGSPSEAELKRQAVEAEQQRTAVRAEEERQEKATAEADAKRKALETEQQRRAAQAERERQEKAAAEAEAKRKADRPAAARLTQANVVELFARLPLILERVRNDYVEPVDERKLLGGATQGMLKAEPPAATISSADRRGGLGGISLDTIYDTALDILNGRKTDSNDAQLVDAAIKGLLDELDQHAIYVDEKNLMTQTPGVGGLGIEITLGNGLIKVVAPIDQSPAAKAGLRAGDLITQINGEQVQGLTLQQAVLKIRGPVGTIVTLTVQRSGVEKPLDVAIERATVRMPGVRWSIVGNNIGYIRIAQFNPNSSEGLKAAVTDVQKQIAADALKGYIIDVRNSQSGPLDSAISSSDEFLDRGEIVSTRGRKPQDNIRFEANAGDSAKGKPIVVLINAGTTGTSEIFAGALQDNKRATVVGSRSFGLGNIQTVIPLGEKNGALQLTTARYFTPSGRSIQASGITPDIEVLQTDVPANTNDDKVMQRAINLLHATKL